MLIIKKKLDLKIELNEFKSEINYQVDNLPLNEIDNLANIIYKHNANIFTCGVGKCKNLSNNLCDLLKSIDIKCFNICPMNLFHGDYGSLKKMIL